MKIKRDLTVVARKVRTWCEHHYKDKPTEFNEKLRCMCGIASAQITKRLIEKGYSPEIYENGGHAFVKCSGHLIDVTATQFGHPQHVIVENWDWNNNKDYWHPTRRHSLKDFIEHQDSEWPMNQRASNYLEVK